MPEYQEVADEYRVAYQQLQATEKRMLDATAALQRDVDLAEKRYEGARRAYCELALGEDDEFLKADD